MILIKYEHMKCECGGIIGMYNGKDFTCGRCGKKFDLYRIPYDEISINDKTGWISPVKIKENNHD